MKQIENKPKNERGLSHHAIFPPKMNACCGTSKAHRAQIHDAQLTEDCCDCSDCDFEAERWDGMS